MRTRDILILALLSVVTVPLLRGQGQQPQQTIPQNAGAQNTPAAFTQEIKIYSQEYIPQDAHAIRVKSTMVPVPVVVRDSHGNVVKGLKREDFQVFDEGKQQNITYFDMELSHPPAPTATAELPSRPSAPSPAPAAPPRYLGFYFDDNTLLVGDMAYARKAAEDFVTKNMEESDRVGVFTSSATVTQQFTSNRQQLLDALSQLQTHKREATIDKCPNITPYQAYTMSLFRYEPTDALNLAVAEAYACKKCTGLSYAMCVQFVQTLGDQVLSLSESFARDSLGVLGDVIHYMGKMPGRRTLIMASSGFFSDSENVQHDQDMMIDRALKNGVVVNTIDAKGLFAPYDPADLANDVPIIPAGTLAMYQQDKPIQEKEVADDPLAALAQGTGGKFFHNSNDLDEGVRQLAELPEVSYVVGFNPDESRMNGAKRSIKVKVPGQNGLHIDARPSYFVPTKQEAAPGVKYERLNKEVMGSDTLNQMSARVMTETGTLATGESALRITAHVDGHSLSFKKENNKTRNERIIFITALFDTHGHFLAGNQAVMDMQLKDETRAQIQKDGVNAKATLQAPPGNYVLREVVQEVVGGRISATSQPVRIQ